MAGRLAAVPEESMDCSTAAYPPRSNYRDWIRTVAVSGQPIRSPFSHSQSGHSVSSYSSNSGASYSYPSNNSGCSSGSPLPAAAADFGIPELKTIAGQMVSDGYTQRMVQAAFDYGGGPDHAVEIRFFEIAPLPAFDHALESWFLELDVAWVLQIRQGHGSQWQLGLQDNSGSSLQDLVQRWIRGLTVSFFSLVELLSIRHEMTSVLRFGETSISKMLIFVDAIVPALKAEEDLRALLDMYICVRKAMENSEKHPELVYLSLTPTLSVYVNMLKGAIASSTGKVKTRIEDDDSWAIEIPRGRGEVDRNTRWFADCLVSLDEADIGQSHCELLDYMINLLLRKSELCSDSSLRYLFLLNNTRFVKEMIDQRCVLTDGWIPLFAYRSYIDCYLDVSWGHVLSSIQKPNNSPGPLQRWINTSSLAKFESAFNKTYQVQKFWKVPDPRLRYELRRAITQRVVSSYRDYLKEHPELAEHISRRNSTPEVLEEMLGQLFEG
uniref:Uncharacterized protein n=1 Tax=Avena sativa TaxID=4498 RepID=A0ACD5Z169_AVESA